MSFELGTFIFLCVLALFTGRIVDFRHLRSLKQREAATAHMLVHNLSSFPELTAVRRPVSIVNAEVVIATDYFKNFVAKLRQLVGGEMYGYGVLMMRARREALLRLKEAALSQGFNALANVRLNTADIGGAQSGRGVVMVTVLASATAYRSEVLASKQALSWRKS